MIFKGNLSMETRQFVTKFKGDIEKMKAQVGPATSGFAGLFSKVMADGDLTVRARSTGISRKLG